MSEAHDRPHPALTDAVVVRVERTAGPTERRRYEPRADNRWTLIEEVWTGSRWRERGREVIAGLSVSDGRC